MGLKEFSAEAFRLLRFCKLKVQLTVHAFGKSPSRYCSARTTSVWKAAVTPAPQVLLKTKLLPGTVTGEMPEDRSTDWPGPVAGFWPVCPPLFSKGAVLGSEKACP